MKREPLGICLVALCVAGCGDDGGPSVGSSGSTGELTPGGGSSGASTGSTSGLDGSSSGEGPVVVECGEGLLDLEAQHRLERVFHRTCSPPRP